MRLIHNYYIDFLKSLKRFFIQIYGDHTSEYVNGILTSGGIKHFEFNYASKSLLQYKLYNQIGFEYPTCLINLTDIITDNADPRFINTGVFNSNLSIPLSLNETNEMEIRCRFKWVTAYINIRINFENGADVLNYYDRLHNLPINFNFYSYKYNSYIDVTSLVEDDPNNYDNLVFKIENTSAELRYYSLIPYEPIFKINNKQKNIQNDNNEYFINLDLEVQIPIPTILYKSDAFNNIVKNIEIVITDTFGLGNPILIDTNMVYIDNKRKISNILILDKKDFIITTEDITTGGDDNDLTTLDDNEITTLSYINIKIPIQYQYLFNNKILSIYFNEDTTNQNPLVIHKKLGLFNVDGTNILIDDNYIYFRELITSSSELNNCYNKYISFSELKLIIFNL